jgi:3-methyladenine DNA glycosylase AlkD
MNEVLSELRNELLSNSDDKVKQSSSRFFKEVVTLHGVKSSDIQRIEKGFYSLVREKGKRYIFTLCESLWQSPYFEENIIACNWAYNQHKEYAPEDIAIFRGWLEKYVNNWATCDTLCNHAIGSLIMMYPELIGSLKSWTHSKNRWMRRGAAVSLIVPARKGLFLPDIFEIATTMLCDSDDMVQKGYGWMLKVASQAHQQQVYGFVMHHRSSMPRTALRYAIEKMPPALRAAAMEKP